MKLTQEEKEFYIEEAKLTAARLEMETEEFWYQPDAKVDLQVEVEESIVKEIWAYTVRMKDGFFETDTSEGIQLL